MRVSGYCELLECVEKSSSCVGERATMVLPDELHLQALWFAGQMGREFVTVDGKSVRVVQFGYWNHAAGPDFLHTAVEIDGVLMSGSLELDHTAQNWEIHGHSENEAFHDVVLHVVFTSGGREFFTRTSEHREVPRVVVSEEVLREALQLPVVKMAAAYPGKCSQPLAEMHEGNVDALLREAARHRISQKLKRRNRNVDVRGEGEWLWQAFAQTLGYRPNQMAMTLLAQRVPVEDLGDRRDDVEAILFGSAGFLSAELYEEADSQAYVRGLWERWWRVRGDYEPAPSRVIPWKFSGIRPVNHPQRRLACLALVARRWGAFKKACQSVAGVEAFFQELKHDYWSHHYTLKSKRSDRALALVGRDRLQDFYVNHMLLAKLAEGNAAAWEYYQKIPAPAMSEKVDKASIRLFGSLEKRKKFVRKAWQHQALLQIYQDFCLKDLSECSACVFPEQLAQWRG